MVKMLQLMNMNGPFGKRIEVEESFAYISNLETVHMDATITFAWNR